MAEEGYQHGPAEAKAILRARKRFRARISLEVMAALGADFLLETRVVGEGVIPSFAKATAA